MDSNDMSDEVANLGSNGKDGRRQQFTNKQRMDMYAFCVLELELHSNKVSIRRQQQAIEKALAEQQRGGQSNQTRRNHIDTSGGNQHLPEQLLANNITLAPNTTETQAINTALSDHSVDQQPFLRPAISSSTLPEQNSHSVPCQNDSGSETLQLTMTTNGQNDQSPVRNGTLRVTDGPTLIELQERLAMTRKCYSDHQKTQVLTSSMLRDVQKRFAKYYPDSAIPSRTTIKHVFDKCVSHGTVENVKTPRKASKITQNDEIQHLLIHEPQLSLRRLAQKLNVSTGTISRRCKALGLIPDSVTIKHQQMASARRQKQIKRLEGQTRDADKSALESHIIGKERNGRDHATD